MSLIYEYLPEDIDYAARVKAGINILDQKWPEWWSEIDINTLEIRSSKCCVTAQLSGIKGFGYWWREGLEYLGIVDEVTAVNSGFNVESSPYIYTDHHDWEVPEGWENYTFGNACDILTEIWKREIMARRGEAEYLRNTR